MTVFSFKILQMVHTYPFQDDYPFSSHYFIKLLLLVLRWQNGSPKQERKLLDSWGMLWNGDFQQSQQTAFYIKKASSLNVVEIQGSVNVPLTYHYTYTLQHISYFNLSENLLNIISTFYSDKIWSSFAFLQKCFSCDADYYRSLLFISALLDPSRYCCFATDISIFP